MSRNGVSGSRTQSDPAPGAYGLKPVPRGKGSLYPLTGAFRPRRWQHYGSKGGIPQRTPGRTLHGAGGHVCTLPPPILGPHDHCEPAQVWPKHPTGGDCRIKCPCNGKPRNTRAHQRPPRAPPARFATGRPDRPLQRRGPLKWPCAANARTRSQIPDWHWQPGEEHPKNPGSRTTWSWGIAHTQKIYFKRMISSMHLGPPPVCTQGARRVGTASGLGRHLCIVHTQT